MILIKKFSDGSKLEFDNGNFDDWCVFLTRPNGKRYAPIDKEYFNFFYNLSQYYSQHMIYGDFVEIYVLTNKKIEQDVLNRIAKISRNYDNYSTDVEIYFTVMYAGMIAEENKKYTKLGKRIKRLGFHQVIEEGLNPSYAAHFSRGMSWRDIDKLCSERNF